MEKSTKYSLVDAFKAEIAQAHSVVLAEFNKYTVPEVTELRRKLRLQGVTYRVIKNTLAKRAIAGTPAEALNPLLRGTTAWIYSKVDPVTPAKIVSDLFKDIEDGRIKIKGGYLGGKALTPAEVAALAKLPGKNELRSRLLSVFLGTATKFVRVLSARPSEFLNVLKARQDDLEKKA
jgi:large subunit ribosomal protein L10